MDTQKLLRRRDVLAATGISRSSLFRLVAGGEFPQPVRLGERATAFLESEVVASIERRVDDRDARRGPRS